VWGKTPQHSICLTNSINEVIHNAFNQRSRNYDLIPFGYSQSKFASTSRCSWCIAIPGSGIYRVLSTSKLLRNVVLLHYTEWIGFHHWRIGATTSHRSSTTCRRLNCASTQPQGASEEVSWIVQYSRFSWRYTLYIRCRRAKVLVTASSARQRDGTAAAVSWSPLLIPAGITDTAPGLVVPCSVVVVVVVVVDMFSK